MAIPNNFHYFQKVIIAQVALTLFFFVLFQTIYYIKWGYDEEGQKHKQQNADGASSRKWDQKTWNSYFPIIFANHLIALALPIIYSPEAYLCVFAFIHFGLFLILLLVNILVSQEVQGEGNRTKASRVLWALMFLDNIFLIIAGLAGAGNVLK